MDEVAQPERLGMQQRGVSLANEANRLGAGNAAVAAGRLARQNGAAVDPPLDRGFADPDRLGELFRAEEGLHSVFGRDLD